MKVGELKKELEAIKDNLVAVMTTLNNLAQLGVYDGAHHKDWVIQEMWRTAMGWTEEELQMQLDMLGWERGVSP